MRGTTRQTATAFHYKITVSNESWWHVAALSKSGKILSVALQLTQLTTTSKYLCSRFEGSLLLHRSKSTNSSTKWQPPWRIVDLNRKIILFLPTDLIEDSVIIICLWLEGSLSVHLALGSTATCGRPSASLEFLHSLIPPHYACCFPKHNSLWRSLSMLVSSHSNTHHLNRHMVGCGCHEKSDQSRSSQGCMA